jgi:hypothetical protein
MARKRYDPLQFIPSPEVVREQLEQTLVTAERLRVLLEVSERIQSTRAVVPSPDIAGVHPATIPMLGPAPTAG